MADHYKRLTQEGENLIRIGDLPKGIQLLEDARKFYERQVLDDDESRFLLSVIYCQLGNAHYALKDFWKACMYHRRDCEQCANSDPIQKAKAMSNYSMALSMEGRQFDEAINYARQVICESHLITPNADAQAFLCRGYYNLGVAFFQRYLAFKQQNNVFDAACFDDLNEAAKAFKTCIGQSLHEAKVYPNCDLFYNLAVGNLALVYAFHGKFEQAQSYYNRRLEIARSVGDITAQWRTHVNMGDAYVQTNQLEDANGHYRAALSLLHSQQDGHPEQESLKAKLFFNIGTTFSLLEDYENSLYNHLEHYRRAEDLNDVGGMARSRVLIEAALEKLEKIPESCDFLLECYRRAENPDENDVALIRTANQRKAPARPPMPQNPEDIFDLVERVQGRRIDAQRTELRDTLPDSTAESHKSDSLLSTSSSMPPPKSAQKRSGVRRVVQKSLSRARQSVRQSIGFGRHDSTLSLSSQPINE